MFFSYTKNFTSNRVASLYSRGAEVLCTIPSQQNGLEKIFSRMPYIIQIEKAFNKDLLHFVTKFSNILPLGVSCRCITLYAVALFVDIELVST